MTMKAYSPKPYQTQIFKHIIKHKKCAIWCFMGAGKTVATLTAIHALQLVESGPVLILAPRRVAQSTWPGEAEKWAHLSDLRVTPLLGAPKSRIKALQSNADIFTINYENIQWLVDTVGDSWPFKTVVAI